MWVVGIDVGGTFTDLFARDLDTGEERTAKVLTTPEDRVVGVMTAIEAAELNVAAIARLVHGTTTATNALIERNYPDAAMITTHGFRDVLEIGRMHREHLYRPYQTKPIPLIKRRFRYTIDERTSSAGEVVRPVDRAEINLIAEQLRRAEIQSVAVCLLNSYVNDDNERRVAEHLNATLPSVVVVTSADVKPIFREHTRFSTAAVRTVLLPVMANYFSRLENELQSKGFAGSLMILKSSGGMMTVDQAKLRVEELVESGPAGGVAYAAKLSRMTGMSHLIHTDVGGTSFDASIVEYGRGLITREYEIEFDIPIAVPMLDIRSIGSGGGSIGWIDDGGSLRVGPESAGSSPGPACYGRGGDRPTITDANLILGRINEGLGGKFRLDRDASVKAMRTIADRLDLTPEACAEGMFRIASEAMAQAVKMVLASRGRDPRDYALTSFGGAGPMHAYFVAQALGIPKVVIPHLSGVASAHGATEIDLRHDEEEFLFVRLGTDSPDVVYDRLDALHRVARHELVGQGVPAEDVRIDYTLRMRYAGQTFEVDTPVEAAMLHARDLAAIADTFHRTHEREYGAKSDDFDVEIVGAAVAASATVQTPSAAARTREPIGSAKSTTRQVYFNGAFVTATVYQFDELAAGIRVVGPAIIEHPHTSVTLPPAGTAVIDDQQNLIMEVDLG